MKIEHLEPEPTNENETNLQKPKSSLSNFFSTKRGKQVIGIIVVLVVVIGLVFSVYKRSPDDKLVRFVSAIIPIPAISVDSHSVRMSEYLVEYDALINYFNSIGEVDEIQKDQIKDTIVETLINKEVVNILTEEHGISVDDEIVEAYYNEVVLGQGGQESFETEAQEMFGWTNEEFKERIVEPIVLALKMSSYVLSNVEIQSGKRSTVDNAHERIMNGEDFVLVAKEVHTQEQVMFETDLGFIKMSELPEELVHVIGVLQEDEVTDVIDMSDAFVIFQLKERIKTGDDSQLHLYSLTVPKKTLEDMAKEYLLTAKVKRYIKS